MKNTAKESATKAVRSYVEGREAASVDFRNFIKVMESQGVTCEWKPGGRGNAGYEFRYHGGAGFKAHNNGFIYDNTDLKRQPNISVRVSHGIAESERFPWKTWGKRADMKVTEDGDKNNVRVACYSRDALEAVMIKTLWCLKCDVKKAAKAAAKTANKAVKGGAA